MLDPDMKSSELRQHMGELTAQGERDVRAAIRWANAEAAREIDVLAGVVAAVRDERSKAVPYDVGPERILRSYACLLMALDAILAMAPRPLAVVEMNIHRAQPEYGGGTEISFPVNIELGRRVRVEVYDAEGGD